MSMLTELDLSISELAEIYHRHRWFPATNEDIDIETRLRETLRDLLSIIEEYPERQEGIAGTMRLFLEKDPECNMAQIYLQIGSVEW